MIGILLLAALMTAQAAPPVVVEGEACDLRSALPSALARRGLLSREGSLKVVIDASRIEIVRIDRSGATRVRRVPRSPSCAADLDLVVLIVERQQRDLGLAPDAAPLPVATATTAPWTIHLDLGASGGVEIGERAHGTAELALRLEVARAIEAMIGARVGVPASADVVRRDQIVGAIEVWSLGGWVGAGAGIDTGRHRLFGAGTIGVERIIASTSGLFQAADQGVWSVSLGLEGRYELALIEEKLWLSLGIGGRFRPSAPVFGVEGASSSFAVSPATLTARAGVWTRFF